MLVRDDFYVSMPQGLFKDTRLDVYDKTILTQLIVRAMGSESVEVSFRELSDITGIKKYQSISNHLKVLEETGWITTEHGGKFGDNLKKNTYTIHYDNTCEVERDSVYGKDIEMTANQCEVDLDTVSDSDVVFFGWKEVNGSKKRFVEVEGKKKPVKKTNLAKPNTKKSTTPYKRPTTLRPPKKQDRETYMRRLHSQKGEWKGDVKDDVQIGSRL